jgi:hypothetical protein
MKYINQYTAGLINVTHRGKVIASVDKNKLYETVKNLEYVDIDVGYIPAGYEHRPDLISDLFYNTVTKDWLIVMFNNIKDPFQQLNAGDRILLPRV